MCAAGESLNHPAKCVNWVILYNYVHTCAHTHIYIVAMLFCSMMLIVRWLHCDKFTGWVYIKYANTLNTLCYGFRVDQSTKFGKLIL